MTNPRDALSKLWRLAVCAVLALVLAQSAFAQREGTDVLETIRDALENANADQLVEHGSDRIDLTIFGTSELISRSQAMYVLKSFMAEYPPVDVEFVDTSASDGNWFASAAYVHEASSVSLSVYVRLRQGSAGWELRELRIDRSPPR